MVGFVLDKNTKGSLYNHKVTCFYAKKHSKQPFNP